MDAVFAFKIAVGVVALDLDGGGLDAGLFAVLIVEQRILIAVAVGPHGVHAVEHLRPVLRLGAAGTGVERQNGVVRVVLAGEQRGKTHFFQLFRERIILRFQLFKHGGIVLFERHFTHGEKIVPGRAELVVLFALRLQLLDALLHLLRMGDIVPEAVLRALLLQLGDLALRLFQMERVLQIVQRRLERVELAFILFKFQH